MSATRYFVAECTLCRTKFETALKECPVCGGTSMRAIRETVAAAEAIPVPMGRTKPPAALRRRAAAPAGPTVRVVRRKKTAGGVATGGVARPAPSGGVARPIRIDVADAEKRLEAALAELRSARHESFAAARRKIKAESAVRCIRAELDRAKRSALAVFRGKPARKRGLSEVVRTVVKFFASLVSALL